MALTLSFRPLWRSGSLRRLFFTTAAVALVALPASAQGQAREPEPAAVPAERDERGPTVVRAVRAAASPKVDGQLDDAIWQTAPAVDGFRRVFQREGEPSGQRTVVRLAYDDDALYAAAWLFDTAPDSISSRLFRRDEGNDGEADRFILFLDTFHDRRTAYGFGVNAAGSLLDVTYTNDQGNGDGSWDGVWEGKAGRFDGGWTVEMRIPFAQLRFARKDVQTWGINAYREIQRTREFSMLRYQKESEQGFVSLFPELRGIEGVRPGLGFEIAPYATTRLDVAPSEAGDPFFDGSRLRADVGVDLKARLTSNLTLAATVNPDFGQVEVDPAEVNLSGFETFFSERRPFFVEGSSTFDFGSGPGGNNGFNWVNFDPFYSRRIGRAPQGGLPPSAFSDVPESARILGAAKLTGRVGETVVGGLSALTARTFARTLPAIGAGERRVEVEPLSHYGILRALRAFDGGNRGVGLIGTATNRLFSGGDYPADADLRDRVNGSAQTLGLDAWQVLGTSGWIAKGWLIGSRVAGTADRIAALQRSSVHLLQRPDREGVRYDPTRTSLGGWGTRLQLIRNGAPWFGSFAVGAISPTLDVNDVGFIGRTDVVNGHAFAGHVVNPRAGWLQRRQLMAAVFANATFDGDVTTRGLWSRADLRTRGFWNLGLNVSANLDGLDAYATRGGPMMKSLGGMSAMGSVETDARKAWQVGANLGGIFSGQRQQRDAGLDLNWRPNDRLRLGVGPELMHARVRAQWVTNQADARMTETYGVRHVFADLDQWQAAANVRLNWTFSPTVSLQLFAQPLVASGEYSGYKELARPRSFDFTDYATSEAGGTVTADPDGAGAAPAFSFGNPDFRFASLRGNAVFRWEYRPGSTLFLVWTQQREAFEPVGTFDLDTSRRQLADADASHVVALKLTYWLGR